MDRNRDSATDDRVIPFPGGRPLAQAQPAPVHGFGASVSDAAAGLWAGLLAAGRGIALDLAEVADAASVGAVALAAGRWGPAVRGFGKVAVRLLQMPANAFLMLGGRLTSSLQTLTGLESPGRRLSDDERALARAVFGPSLDLSRVRIKEGPAGLLTIPGRPFVLGDTLYVPEGWIPLDRGALVHELVHVWQHQHGGTNYLSEALWAQYFGEGYDLHRGLSGGKSWPELNPEQQAELIEAGVRSGWFEDPTRTVYVEGRSRTRELLEALGALRAGQGAP